MSAQVRQAGDHDRGQDAKAGGSLHYADDGFGAIWSERACPSIALESDLRVSANPIRHPTLTTATPDTLPVTSFAPTEAAIP